MPSKFERVVKHITPSESVKEPTPKSTGPWKKYAHREVGPEVIRIVRPFKRGKKKRGHAWRGYNNHLFQKGEK